MNINRSVSEAKCAFMDNLFLNVWPSKPDGINGSEWIKNVPALSEALKQCAHLRKQFLSYFTEGTLIGACLMPEPAPDVRPSAYVLPERVLAIVLNPGPAGALSFKYDLSPWVVGPNSFVMRCYDQEGKLLTSEEATAAGALQTPNLTLMEIAVFEFEAK